MYSHRLRRAQVSQTRDFKSCIFCTSAVVFLGFHTEESDCRDTFDMFLIQLNFQIILKLQMRKFNWKVIKRMSPRARGAGYYS